MRDLSALQRHALVFWLFALCVSPAYAQEAKPADTKPVPVTGSNPLTKYASAVLQLRWNALTSYHLPLLQLWVNGTPLLCLLDTGVTAPLLIDEPIAEQLKLKKRTGANASATMQDANDNKQKIESVTLDTLAVKQASGEPLPIDLTWAYTAPIHATDETVSPEKIGIYLGAAMLNNATIVLDYEAQSATLIFKEHPPVPSLVSGVTLPLRRDEDSSLDYVEWTPAPGKTPVLAVLDSGMNVSKLPAKWIQSLSSKGTRKAPFASAFSLKQDEVSHLVALVHVGPYTLSNVEISEGSQAVLGADILSRFRVYIDYRRKQVTLEPTSRTKDLYEVKGRSGLTLTRQNGALVISEVNAQNPAFAHLKGKEVLAIDGTPTKNLYLRGAQYLLDGFADTNGTIRIKTGKVEQEVTFTRSNAYRLPSPKAGEPKPAPTKPTQTKPVFPTKS